MAYEIVERQVLRHNPRNAVTASVERVTDQHGISHVRKELRAPQADVEHSWAASADPRHWNYWQREAQAYLSAELRASLADTGLAMPAAEVELTDAAAVLWLEDVAGTAGTEYELADHQALARSLGRWQAAGPFDAAWASRGFIRAYSASRPGNAEVIEDDAAWQQPLIRQCWPAGLRAGWRRLQAHREQLLTVLAELPRTRSHLDVWVSNQVRRPGGEIVLLDWAFFGDGAYGEDLGNHIPDAALDLFWPAERLAELDDSCFGNYLAGLREADWHGSERDIRLGVVAACVKYSWLLPLMLEQAGRSSHAAYHQTTDSVHLYRQRGIVLEHLVGWCDEAVRLIG